MLLASVAYGLISNIIDSILVASFGKVGLAGLIEFLMRSVFQVLLGTGMISFALKAHDDVMAARLQDFWHPQPFWNYAATTVLLFVIIGIGLILLVVPGIIAILTFMFATYLVVDRGLTPIAALKESARMTKGQKLDLLLFVLQIIGITLLGLLCLFVGIFVAIPIVALSVAHAYRTLSKYA
jgi:uncharacterized membrane protein